MGRIIEQVAALAIRDNCVCMVTSRNRRRWVIPKGQIEKGQSATETALAEAWEEAGLLGRIESEPIGTFSYTKNNLEHIVTVFPMIVTIERNQWPECRERRRVWLALDQALARIHEQELRELLQAHCELAEVTIVS